MILKNSLDLLEFNKLLSIISDYSCSDAGKKSTVSIAPLESMEDISKRSGQITEIREMSRKGNPLQLSAFTDIRDFIAKVRPEGAVLDAIELAEFVPVFAIASAVSRQMKETHGLFSLRHITDHLTGFPDILKTLRKSVDSEGNILDTASFLLSDLRAQIRILEGRIRRRLEEMVRDEKLSLLLQDDFVTTRSGRWVLPVRMDSKGMVPGVVHDISKSGETAFIEPLGIIQLANELESLKADQKAEELRILRDICSAIRKVINEVEAEFDALVYLDVLHSIAQFADTLRMEPPQINDANIINIVAGRHPLLQLSLKNINSENPVVPLDVSLGDKNTVMVITGANAGGKTIAIKTIGLLLLMALSGMHVPSDPSSSFPLVRNILADIGDEQSIENNLSTFSAHISNISEIISHADSKTVILIDELGTGTDPDEGAALACAILKEIRNVGALVFATTHLADIKGFVHRTDGMINASMEFDTRTLTPLFRLRAGEPGQSHAIEIAKRYGLPESLIADAKELLGSVKIEFDSMVADVNEKRILLEESLGELSRKLADADEKNRVLAHIASEQEKKKKEILAAAYKEASVIISDVKRQMNKILQEFKEKGGVERQKTLKAVEVVREAVSEKLMEFETEFHRIPSIDDIKKGDTVFVRSLGYDAPVKYINPNNKRVKVIAQNMEIDLPLSDLGFRSGKNLPVFRSSPSADLDAGTVSREINLIGLRVEEAVSKLEQFLNHASLSELRQVFIIHGIGKGLLHKAVHAHLKEHPLVHEFRSGSIEEGGKAVTIAILK
jgi:DNA mismatch repair protein MutS2